MSTSAAKAARPKATAESPIQRAARTAAASQPDQRPATVAQRKLQADISSSPRVQQAAAPAQRQENNTGLPDNLKTGVESLSGYSLDDVKVHYNSAKPAGLQAHAYAQGTDIHVAPGQEKHLPHEAWHVVQQKQGRVKPTMQLKGNVNVNGDSALEKEADVMGVSAASDFNRSDATPLSPSGLEHQHPGADSVAQFALPVSFEEWRAAQDEAITAGGTTDDERTTFGQLHYIVELVAPFLETRYDYISAHDGDYAEAKIAAIQKRLRLANTLYREAQGPVATGKFLRIKERYQANSLSTLISQANALPTTLENVKDNAGGYMADASIRSGMPALGRTLNQLASSGDDALAPAPAATVAKATKAVPSMSKSKFLGSEAVPVALRRLVMDIYLHWKSRKVMDTRTATQKAQKAKTPDQTGALRTYHMNEHATIPALAGPYAGDHPLHQHYVDTSQGSSVHGGEPYGFAEYTGIDSDQNKIVLDYVNGTIYITSTHYKHWFDMGADGVSVESGDIADSRSKIGGKKTEANLQSPWVKIVMN